MRRPETTRGDTNTLQSQEQSHPKQRICPECASGVVCDNGEAVCKDCGLVVEEDKIDHGPEWRAFTSSEEDSKSRTGSPTTMRMHDRGLSTKISWMDRDGYGNTLNSKQKAKFRRLRQWQTRTQITAEDQRLKEGLSEVERMGSALGAPDDVRETAAVIFRTSRENDLLPGRSVEAMASSALYHSFRIQSDSRSLDEIATVARVGRKEISRAYRYLSDELGLDTVIQHPAEFIPRFTSRIGGSRLLKQQAKKIAEEVEGTQVTSGKSPTTIAAACIYISGQLIGEKYTQDTVAEAANVSSVTVRYRYRSIAENFDLKASKLDTEQLGLEPNETEYHEKNTPDSIDAELRSE